MDKDISEIRREIIEIQTDILHKITEERNISKEQFRIIMEGVNRLESRLDSHVENQASLPIQQLESLKKMINDYFVVYKEETDRKIKHNTKCVIKTQKEVFGNGKAGLKNEMGIVKAKLNMVIWLVGIILTGGGVSVVGLIVWKIITGGLF
jgi:hypothetical protein